MKRHINSIATDITIVCLTLAQAIVLARYLGPAGRGEFFITTFIVSTAASLLMLGVNTAIARDVGKRGPSAEIRSAALFASQLTGWACAVVLAAGVLWDALPLSERQQNLILAFCVLAPLNHAVLNLQAVDQGTGHLSAVNRVRLVLNPVFLAGLLGAQLVAEDPVIVALIALILANAVTLGYRLYLSAPFSLSRHTTQAIGRIGRGSLQFSLVPFFVLLQQQSDKILVVGLLDPAEAGLYAVASAVSINAGVINSAISKVVFSDAVRSPDSGSDSFAQTFRKSALLSGGAAALIAGVAPAAFPYVFGVDFSGSLALLYLLLPCYVFSSLSQLVDDYLKAIGRPRVGILASIACVTISAAGAVVFAERYRATGIAISFLLGCTAALTVLLYGWRNHASGSSSLKDLAPSRIDIQQLAAAIRSLGKRA